ncbi:MAG: glycoside hydrolase family 13 protein [Clostridiales Family XIII bacterium]|nr:glycoside hydrolase family 13 protein [Clostridiales Family XIII bacterium]
MFIIHDSAKEIYRLPLGAVKTSTRIYLSLHIFDAYPTDVILHFYFNNEHRTYPMYIQDGLCKFEYDTPDYPVVVWYHFEIRLNNGQTVFYGASNGYSAGVGDIYTSNPASFQITVYDRNFTTPEWAKNSIMYQIFPDRFCRGDEDAVRKGVKYHNDLGRDDIILHDDWNDEPDYLPREGKPYYSPTDVFGGDLQGIIDKLHYLKQLGVTLLYINPVFEATSNHRYNTGDYHKIDPILGTNEDMDELIEAAQNCGMRIMLDGVFSHTGDDSVYFNKYGRYPQQGAYQSRNSAYYNWYRFITYPDKYMSWWGFDTLPEVEERNPDWIGHIMTNDDSVFNHWLEAGVWGFRLDVADELPDQTIETMRDVLKAEDPDNFLLGEVWEDATTKQAYGTGRTYALGRGLDSVMNYPFTDNTISFLLQRQDAYQFRRFLISQHENYPPEMYYVLMNLLSSHDVARVRTILGTGIDSHGMTREEQGAYVITEEQDKRGRELQLIASVIQYAVPGIPSIYYGDEVGMNGFADPFNRRPYKVHDKYMYLHHKKLSYVHNNYSSMRTGKVIFYASQSVIGILRYDDDNAVLTAVNPTDFSHKLIVDLTAEEECVTGADCAIFKARKWRVATNLYSRVQTKINGGLIEMDLAPRSFRMYEVSWRKVDNLS